MNTNRYIRQTSLKDFGEKSQDLLLKSRVLVVGAGGLGIPVLQYLNAMGVGTLGIVEGDKIEFSNLQRQVIYTEKDIGRAKLEVISDRLKAQNSNTSIIGHDTFLTRDNAMAIIPDYDIIVDATDNFPTRYLINDACVILGKPFVYGALHGYEAQLSVFNYQNGPTYRCLFPNMPAKEEIPDCNINGVLGVIPGIVGSLQALEVVKIITQKAKVLSGVLLIYNGLDQSFLKINFSGIDENKKIRTLGDYYFPYETETTNSISAAEFHLLMENETPLQVIDVRTADEFQNNHLANTINIPLEEIDSRHMEIDFSNPLYMICQSGNRSRIAQQKLQNSYNKAIIFNVLGGINQYNALLI
ncbi:HesA/MoeB/ThiF family protein [uncultured Eudoraea sp.]|uniref:HesA/MoeB/ThiF family protein n=1 Tax=uncultured Eudoraea sp. TaxID=1035614 RepID=UPI002638BFAC|nr:HesA/MoeB/ThiF family protein [uncultured Eudoraea sp.]